MRIKKDIWLSRAETLEDLSPSAQVRGAGNEQVHRALLVNRLLKRLRQADIPAPDRQRTLNQVYFWTQQHSELRTRLHGGFFIFQRALRWAAAAAAVAVAMWLVIVQPWRGWVQVSGYVLLYQIEGMQLETLEELKSSPQLHTVSDCVGGWTQALSEDWSARPQPYAWVKALYYDSTHHRLELQVGLARAQERDLESLLAELETIPALGHATVHGQSWYYHRALDKLLLPGCDFMLDGVHYHFPQDFTADEVRQVITLFIQGDEDTWIANLSALNGDLANLGTQVRFYRDRENLSPDDQETPGPVPLNDLVQDWLGMEDAVVEWLNLQEEGDDALD